MTTTTTPVSGVDLEEFERQLFPLNDEEEAIRYREKKWATNASRFVARKVTEAENAFELEASEDEETPADASYLVKIQEEQDEEDADEDGNLKGFVDDDIHYDTDYEEKIKKIMAEEKKHSRNYLKKREKWLEKKIRKLTTELANIQQELEEQSMPLPKRRRSQPAK